MRDILDPADRWVGVPGTVDVFGNKAPVAIDDTLTVLRDSGPVSVDVLANDFDPEGGVLTLVSASAALGTAAVAPDETVTYTPPPGITGFDTVIYEIADDQEQIRSGQINITVAELQLSIDTQPNNTLTLTATGTIDITVSDPVAFAGTYQVQTSDMVNGPLNLVPPTLTGTPVEGETLNAAGGLWLFDTDAGPLTQSWQWKRNGSDISGATGPSYVVTVGDDGTDLNVVEIQSDASGQRLADSAFVTASLSSFRPDDDTGLIGWWDAADTATLTSNTDGDVTAWVDKAGGSDLVQISPVRQPVTGTRQLNGLNVLDFGGSDFMERAENLPAAGQVAFHIVLDLVATNNAFEAILAIEATNDFQLDSNNAAQFDGRLNVSGIGSPVNLTGGPFSGPMIVSILFDLTGGTAEVFIGDILRGSAPYSTAIDTTSALHLMTNRSKNAYVTGAVAELVVTETITNRATIHDYLSTKWGIS